MIDYLKKNILVVLVIAFLVVSGIVGMGGNGMGAAINRDTTTITNPFNFTQGLTSTTGTFSGNSTVGGTLGVTGASTFTGAIGAGTVVTDRFTQGAAPFASSTTANVGTLTQADMTTYSALDYTPGDLAVTLTLPATSTLTTLIAAAGDCVDFRIRNLDGTAATSTTIAAGTGMDLVENENGDVVIEGGNEAQLKMCRELDTDVTVYVDEYIAAD